MIGVTDAFAPSYAQARVKFLEAAAMADLQTETFAHPLPGRDGEDLAMDVALDGARDASSLLVVSSGCHGVEGFCGSGVQVFALHDAQWREKARHADVAVLYVHALNPHGFSHLRRVTEDNVDLNRNFQDFSQALPANPRYSELHPRLLPAGPEPWPPKPEHEAALMQWANGDLRVFQDIITRGQHTHADGLFYGGVQPTWSNRTIRAVLQRYAQQAQRIGWIDLHTGLGPSGHGERIFAARDDATTFARARRWWDGGGATPVTSIYDGSSSSALLSGMLFNAVYDECPQAEYTGIALEYGTQPVMTVINALRADHWLHLHQDHPIANAAQAAQIKQQLLAAFYTDTDEWKGQIVSQARQCLFQAVDGLSI
jgi:hypothetical protein